MTYLGTMVEEMIGTVEQVCGGDRIVSCKKCQENCNGSCDLCLRCEGCCDCVTMRDGRRHLKSYADNYRSFEAQRDYHE